MHRALQQPQEATLLAAPGHLGVNFVVHFFYSADLIFSTFKGFLPSQLMRTKNAGNPSYTSGRSLNVTTQKISVYEVRKLITNLFFTLFYE